LVPTIYCLIYIVVFFATWIRNIVAGMMKMRLFKIEEVIEEKDYDTTVDYATDITHSDNDEAELENMENTPTVN
jgi:hypothetical protein